MERRTNLGIFWTNTNLGIEEYGPMPLNSHFFEDGKEIPAIVKHKAIEDEHGYIVGTFDKVTEKDPGGMLIFLDKENTLIGIHKSRVIYKK